MSQTARPRLCPACGSEYRPSATSCWLCGTPLPTEAVGDEKVLESKGASNASRAKPVAWTQYSLMTGALWMTLASLWLAVFVAAPGIGILLGIAILPAFIRTTLVAMRRAEQGRAVSPLHKVALFVGSLVTVTISAVVVLVASVGTFCAVCLTAGTESAIPVAVLAALSTTTAAAVAIGWWVRRRWQRDVNHQDVKR